MLGAKANSSELQTDASRPFDPTPNHGFLKFPALRPLPSHPCRGEAAQPRGFWGFPDGVKSLGALRLERAKREGLPGRLIQAHGSQ